MVDRDTVVDALRGLAGPRHSPADAHRLVERKPGLYAFYGDDRAWSDLGLTPDVDEQPLYVGKSESSLNLRDVGTHFTEGRTGSSTLRRSLAATLVDLLDLRAVPRNLSKPSRFTNFGLTADSDERLSRWMDGRLVVATWVSGGAAPLRDLERAVLQELHPPLNVVGVGESRVELRAARKRLAIEARSWRPPT